MTKQEFDEMAALVVRLRKDLELHTDALRQSNAQCSKLLVQNEQLQLQLTSVTKELAYARKAINALDQIDKNITDASALYGRRAGETVSAFIERIASVQRDSCRRTLYDWERADTKPHERVTADDVADHVVPPVLPMCTTCHECGSELANCSQGTNHHDCPRPLCPRTCTGRHGGGFSPYSGPCKSATPVRHE